MGQNSASNISVWNWILVLKGPLLSILSLCLLLSAGCSADEPASEKTESYKVDTSACAAIYDLLVQMKAGGAMEDVSSGLDAILETKPYQVMFSHYNRDWRPNHLPRQVFKRMILSLQYPGQYEPGENGRADYMLENWKRYYQDLGEFESRLKKVRGSEMDAMIARAIAVAQSWLPPEMEVPEFYFVILPQGGSPAFIINDSQGYDLFQLPAELSDLEGIIAHEMHHAGLDIPTREFTRESDAVAYRVLSMFVGEGTANKFINNAPGGNVPPIQPEPRYRFGNPAMEETWRKGWEDLTPSAGQFFLRLSDTFEKAYAGALTKDQLNEEMRDFWLSGSLSPLYFVGSELFGAIYHAFGKEECFRAMRDPRLIFDLYNRAVQKERDTLGRCPLLPEAAVKHALAIGTDRNSES